MYKNLKNIKTNIKNGFVLLKNFISKAECAKALKWLNSKIKKNYLIVGQSWNLVLI